MRIYLVRHGQDLNPTPGYLQGVDVGLDPIGIEQAATCAHRLQKEIGKDMAVRIISSPLKRTRETAQIIAEVLGIATNSIKIDKRLIERNCEAYIGQSVQEVFSLPEEQLIKGGMEPYKNLYERSKALYLEVVGKNEQSVILVTHSGNVQPFLDVSPKPDNQSGETTNDLPADSFITVY